MIEVYNIRSFLLLEIFFYAWEVPSVYFVLVTIICGRSRGRPQVVYELVFRPMALVSVELV